MKYLLFGLLMLVSFSAEAEFNTRNGVQAEAYECLDVYRKITLNKACGVKEMTKSEGEKFLLTFMAMGCGQYEMSEQYRLQSLLTVKKAEEDIVNDKAKACSEVGVTASETPVENTEPKHIDEPKQTADTYMDGKDLLNAANDKLNSVWQSTTPKVRAMMLPEQRD